jgi:hypothetical protein
MMASLWPASKVRRTSGCWEPDKVLNECRHFLCRSCTVCRNICRTADGTCLTAATVVRGIRGLRGS